MRDEVRRKSGKFFLVAITNVWVEDGSLKAFRLPYSCCSNYKSLLPWLVLDYFPLFFVVSLS